jgi:peroxiredoxin Q/BCP
MGREITGVYRTTLIVNESSKIQKIISKVKTKEHGQQILDALEEIAQN